MVVNTIIDIIRYFDREDGVLNSDFITDKVEWCFSFSIEELKDEFRGTIDYLIKKTKPKRGYILRSGVEDSQEMTYEILDDIYDRNYDATDNIKMIKVHPQYNFHKSTVYEYCDNRGIKTNKEYLSDEEIIELIDLSLSSDNKIHGWFKDNGFRVGDKRLRKLIRRKKDMVVKSINGGGGFNNNSSTTINGQAEKDRTFTYSDERDNMVSVKSNQQTSTTINVEIKKGDKNNKNEPVGSSGDWKVDEFLRENYSEWGEAWEEEHNKAYYRQKEIYSTMSNEDILDDIVSWVNDIQKS